MRRLVSLLLVLILLGCNEGFSAAADSSAKQLHAELYVENFDEDSRNSTACLSDLLNVLSMTADTCVTDDDRGFFRSTFCLSLESSTSIDFTVYGSESEWIITSPVLGDVKLLLELGGLCEFAIKTYNHLGIPLQLAAMLIPYIHRSGTAAVISCLNNFLPDEDGTFTFTAESMTPVCRELYSIMQSDRSFTYWLMCIGIRSGFDSIILEEAEYLCDALPETLTVTKNQGIVTDVHSEDMTYYHSEGGVISMLIPETPVYGYRICVTEETEPFSLFVDISSEVSDENAFSLSISAENDLWHIDADGTALNMPLHFMAGIKENESLFVYDAAGIPLVRISYEDIPAGDSNDLFFSGTIPRDAVNIFTLNDTTLASLSDRIMLPVLRGLIPFISRIPSSTCQYLMDCLSDSGILSMLLTGTGNLDE